jgi:hypothetical protein
LTSDFLLDMNAIHIGLHTTDHVYTTRKINFK